MNIELPYGYYARDYQKPFWGALHKEGKKRALCVWHRRAGKDITALNWTVVASQARVGIYYHILPYQNQGRKIVWDGRDGEGRRFRDYWPKELVGRESSTDMVMELKNGSLWQVVGTDNVDSLMGTNPVGCVFSEYSMQDPQAWDYIRPILAENGGWAIFLYTPRGRNHAYDLHMLVKENTEWFTQVLTVDDTGAVTQGAIEDEIAAGMSPERVQQEFYVSYNAPRFGAFYGQHIELTRGEGRITNVPFDPALTTHTFWDLGIDDYTSIWFVQFAGQEIHVVDYYEMDGEGLEHYARVLDEKAGEYQLLYGEHWAPHDIEARELGLGQTRAQTAKQLGIPFLTVKMSAFKRHGPGFVAEGIEAVRNLFHRCWFDEKRCALGIKRLENYRREWNKEMNRFREKPMHDANSNGADAFRTMAMAMKLGAGTKNRMRSSGLDRYSPGSGNPWRPLRKKGSAWAA